MFNCWQILTINISMRSGRHDYRLIIETTNRDITFFAGWSKFSQGQCCQPCNKTIKGNFVKHTALDDAIMYYHGYKNADCNITNYYTYYSYADWSFLLTCDDMNLCVEMFYIFLYETIHSFVPKHKKISIGFPTLFNKELIQLIISRRSARSINCLI